MSALADQALVSGANFATNVVLARTLGLREFGIFVLAWMVVLFVASLQMSLIIAPMMSIGSKQLSEDRPTYYGSVLLQEVAFAISSCAVLFTLLNLGLRLWPNAAKVHQLAVPLAVCAFAYLAQDFFRRYFFATQQASRAIIVDTVSYLPQVPILLMLSRSGELNSPVTLWILAATSMAGAMVGALWFGPVRFRWNIAKLTVVRHWRFSRWLTASSLLQWTSGNLFIVAAPVFYGPAAAAALRVSQNIMGVTHVWFQGLDNIVPAEAAARYRIGGPRHLANYLKSVIVRWGGLTALFAVIVAAVPGFWLQLVYGPQFQAYAYVLRLYGVLYLLIFLGGPLRAGLQALETTLPIFWSYLAMTAFSFAFAVPFARYLGLMGTMAGLLVTQLLFQFIVGVVLWRRLSNSTRSVVTITADVERGVLDAKGL